MNIKLLKEKTKENGLFLLVFCTFLIAHLLYPVSYDDAYRMTFFSNMNFGELFNEIVEFTQTASPRFFTYLIVFVLCWLKHGRIIWCVLDSATIYIILKSLEKLFSVKGNQKWLLIILFCLYPFYDMGSAGFISTTVGYLWVVAALLVSLVILKNIFCKESVKWYEYVIYIMMLLYGTNQEQTCAVFIILLLFLLFLSIKDNYMKHTFFSFRQSTRRRRSVMIVVSLFICFFNAQLLYFNGAANNRINSDHLYFPDFDMMSLFDKLEIGLTTTIQCILMENILFILFLCFICYLVWEKYMNFSYRAMAVIPLIFCVLARVNNEESCFHTVLNSTIDRTGMISVTTYLNKSSYLPLFLMLLICGMTLINLWFLGEEWKESLVMTGIMVLGAASRVVLGFVPSVWPSRTRTFIFLWFAIIIDFIFLWTRNYSELIEPASRKYPKLKYTMECLMPVIAFVAFVNNCIKIMLG